MSLTPSLLPSTPCEAQVAGMNCAIPLALAGLCAFAFQPLSW
ncbi:hypothetical protein SANTM175S_07982 [Streptomyces antimycoticus]